MAAIQNRRLSGGIAFSGSSGLVVVGCLGGVLHTLDQYVVSLIHVWCQKSLLKRVTGSARTKSLLKLIIRTSN